MLDVIEPRCQGMHVGQRHGKPVSPEAACISRPLASINHYLFSSTVQEYHRPKVGISWCSDPFLNQTSVNPLSLTKQ